MSTYLEIQNDIADDLDRNDLSSQIKKAINRSIKYYSTSGFYFQETNNTFSTVIGQNEYTTADGLPSDIRKIDYMEITVTGFDYEVYPRDISWIQQRDPDNYDGDPTDYAWYQERIWFSPNPNNVRTITIYYTKSYSALSDDTDTNDFTTNGLAEELIRARSEWLMYKQVLHDDESAQRAKELEQDALNQLRIQTENYQAGPKNKPFGSVPLRY